MPLPALAPPPDTWIERDQITDQLTDRITVGSRQWLLSLTGRLQTSSTIQSSVAIPSFGSAIGSTPIVTSISGGLYRVTYYAAIATAATISSSLTVTLGWTDHGVAKGFSFTAMTGNTLSTTDSGSRLIRADQGTSLMYSTGYASVGATPMAYDLVIELEALG